jgi:MoxR-like ATPase
MEGTFPLPEPELDRFVLKLKTVPPDETQLDQILERTTEGELPRARKIVDGRRILDMRGLARRVPVDPDVRARAAKLCAVSHADHPQAPEIVRRFVRYGVSPRGAQALVGSAKVRAIMAGRFSVATEDLAAVAHAALRHRLILNYEGQAESIDPDRLVDALLGAAGCQPQQTHND